MSFRLFIGHSSVCRSGAISRAVSHRNERFKGSKRHCWTKSKTQQKQRLGKSSLPLITSLVAGSRPAGPTNHFNSLIRCCTRLPISAQCFANFSISCSMADGVGRALKVLRVMMTVDAIKQFDGHTEEASRFPFVDAGLHNHSTWRAEQSAQCCRRARRHNSFDDLIIRTWRRSARTTQSEHCMWQFAIDILNTDDPSSILRKNVLWSRRLATV